MDPTATSLAMVVPSRTGPRRPGTHVPFLQARLFDGWEWNEGHVQWVVAGTTLLTDDFDLYPMDQVSAVLSILELALARKPGSVNVAGSIITLSTAPKDRHHAQFARSTPNRDAPRGTQQHAAHAEVIAPIIPTARATVAALAELMAHPDLLLPPARPTAGEPSTHAFPQVLDRLKTLDATCRRER